MPANYPIESVYLQTGLFQTENNPTLFKPGELGARTMDGAGHEWQRVQLDSGATAATPIGAVTAGQLAYWKDSANYIVTNDFRVAKGGQTANSGFRNFVAGEFVNVKSDNATAFTLTPGNFICVQKGGPTIVNLALLSSATPAAGDLLVSDTTAATAQVTSVNAGTAATCQIVGVATGAKSSNTVPADLTTIPYVANV